MYEKVTKDESDLQVIINDLNKFQRIKMYLEENNKETENSSDSNNNEDLKDNKNAMKEFQELLNNMKKENEEKFFLLSNEIQSLKNSYNDQKDIIQTQQIDIQSLNNTIKMNFKMN